MRRLSSYVRVQTYTQRATQPWQGSVLSPVCWCLGYSLVLKDGRRKRSQVKRNFQRSSQSIRSLAEIVCLRHCKTKHRCVAEFNLAEMPMMFAAF